MYIDNYPSLEQKQFGNWHFAGSHFRALSSSSTTSGAGAVNKYNLHNHMECRTDVKSIVLNRKVDLLVGTGPHTASFLKVHNFWMSSKKREEGQRLRKGWPSTH